LTFEKYLEAAKKETNSLLRPCQYVALIYNTRKSAKSHCYNCGYYTEFIAQRQQNRKTLDI